MRESTLLDIMDTRLRGYDILIRRVFANVTSGFNNAHPSINKVTV
jgi:hypothetical protein